MKRLSLTPTSASAISAAAIPFFLLLLFSSPLHAQVGDNNPTGVSGIFNGQAGACGYDPYTGNATRSITDIAVAGAVGQYPLALVRTANSRSIVGNIPFGWAGGWNHNYNWIVDNSETGPHNFQPTRYTVYFPDGRVETFQSVNWDPGCYRVRTLGGDANTSAGVRERFVPINPNNNIWDGSLILPDGGQVKFHATQHQLYNQNIWYYTYQSTAIIDPHGLTTTLTYETTGNQRLLTVTEPAGQRSLQFSYLNGVWLEISMVTEVIHGSPKRVVHYNYDPNSIQLTSVVYYSYTQGQTWTAQYTYCPANVDPGNNPPLLHTCDDPMYPGPMKRIGYIYQTGSNADGTHAVYGQISSENYYDGTNIGPAVSTLTVGAVGNNHNTRTETRGDTKTRSFLYTNAGYLTWISDFMSNPVHLANQGYDAYNYINSVTNFNRITTNYSRDPITGNVTQITFPLTPGDTPGQTQRPTVQYTYGSVNCADPNNRDANNPYWVCTATDEGGNVTQFYRDTNHRVTVINYPDHGSELFSYDAGHFYKLQSHQMVTGGTDTFAYDAWHRRQFYSDPYHNNNNNPSIQYFYDELDRVNGVSDALNNPTSWQYNDRGQVKVTTLPLDPYDNQRHTIVNTYNGNGDGTLVSVQNQLSQTTSYTYDNYRRLKSVTTPVRGFGDNGTYITHFYYGANPSDNINDYIYADSNVAWVVLPSGKQTKTIYDDNRRKSVVTVGYGSGDDATTSYGYDGQGNLTSVTHPPTNHSNVTIVPDERNRPSSTSVGSQTTTFTYDTAGRKKTMNRPNGQVITNVSFDAMNRVTQQDASNVSQGNNYNMTTLYTYYGPGEGQPVGFLKTMQDPRLVGIHSSEAYVYAYDLMGRKSTVTYPRPTPGVTPTTEQFSYDTAGRLYQFTNRNGKTQTFQYDALNRVIGFTWNDGGITPFATFNYDPASRLINVYNDNASIDRAYYNDNLLHFETETIPGGGQKTVTYTYDPDGNRASTQYPDNYAFNYTYTGRNQLSAVNGWATYMYNTRGKLTTRTSLQANNTESDYSYDNYDRVTSAVHHLYLNGSGTNRTVTYHYDDMSNNRLWAKRNITPPGSPEDNKGEVFSYDPADQAIGVQLDVLNPDQVQSIPQTIVYDASGNRTSFFADTYNINNLSQYTQRNSINAAYDLTGNLTNSPQSSQLTCTYDAQNRVLTASKNGVSMSFKYDGLNRQVSRTVIGGFSIGRGTTFNVWDGWNLIEEYQAANNWATTAAYVYGADGLIFDSQVGNNGFNYYYQDGSASTSHIANGSGNLQEWYRYDLQGTPVFYNSGDQQISASALGVRYLFTGQQWYADVGLYDLRNRFYSPDLGRFLQPDPIGFDGDPTNLYRYCENNPLIYADPSGLWTFQIGLSITLQWGPFALNGSGGLAFDNHGNIGFYTAAGPGAGLGADAGAAISLVGSNADTIYGLQGWFANAATEGGVIGQGGVESFGGKDAITNKPVLGFGVTGGLGAGGGAFWGATNTNMYGLWPPPGGTTYVDPNCGPNCATAERVVVTGEVPRDVSGYGIEGEDYRLDPYNRVAATHPLTPGSYSWSVPSNIANYFENFGEKSIGGGGYDPGSGAAIMDALNFSMTLSEVLGALGGGGSGPGCQIPRQN